MVEGRCTCTCSLASHAGRADVFTVPYSLITIKMGLMLD